MFEVLNGTVDKIEQVQLNSPMNSNEGSRPNSGDLTIQENKDEMEEEEEPNSAMAFKGSPGFRR